MTISSVIILKKWGWGVGDKVCIEWISPVRARSMKLGSVPLFIFFFNLSKYFKIQIWREGKGSKTIHDGDCGLELTKVPLVPQVSPSTFSKCSSLPGAQMQVLLRCGPKTEQQETRPPPRSLSDPHSLGGLERAGESRDRGSDKENPPFQGDGKTCSGVDSPKAQSSAGCLPPWR